LALRNGSAKLESAFGSRKDAKTLIEMMELRGGSFRMGADKTRDPQACGNEGPVREVRVRPFVIARTQMTRGLYRSLSKERPEAWKGDKEDDALPANYVSWEDAVRFCNAFSRRSRLVPCYRRSGKEWICDWGLTAIGCPPRRNGNTRAVRVLRHPGFGGAKRRVPGVSRGSGIGNRACIRLRIKRPILGDCSTWRAMCGNGVGIGMPIPMIRTTTKTPMVRPMVARGCSAAARSATCPGTCAPRSGAGTRPSAGTSASGSVACVVPAASIDHRSIARSHAPRGNAARDAPRRVSSPRGRLLPLRPYPGAGWAFRSPRVFRHSTA
jgi:hypothetical protein